MPQLTGTSTPIPIAGGGYQLLAPGLVGEVREMTAEESATRGDGGLHEPALLRAIAGAEMAAGKVFEITVESETPAVGPGGARADGLTAVTRSGEPAMALTIPHLEEGAAYAVLYTDEAGVSRWVLPVDPPDAAAPAGRPVHFHLPRESVPTPPEAAGEGPQTRGPISKLGRRLVRVIAWAAADILGEGALAAAERWEAAHRPYGLHQIYPERYAADEPRGDPMDWPHLAQGRALLLLHGTFSSAQASFAQLGRETLQALFDHYQGRFFAFNHPSLRHSPQANVQALLDALPEGAALDLDIMTHSRGGLVGRELVERLAGLDTQGRQVRVHKALLAASPNQGTILADPKNGLDLIDRYTNALTNLPDNAYTLTIEGVLTVLKLLGVGALTGLPGLRCLLPGGDYLRSLNHTADHATTYYALAADYTPSAPALLARLGRRVQDKFIDSIFGGENDMVVPTLGSYSAGPATFGFPIDENRRRVYRGAAQVRHSNYFSTPIVREQIVAWLTETT
ncbi:MAG: hypothetical protein IT318_10950 [Anaerolineales bacterium]|nr:hypothetical protein [Anaerolineales bacterium]